MIRPATPGDARAIGEVQLRAWWRAYQDIVDASKLYAHDADERENRWATWLADAEARTFVAEVAGRIAGFTTVRDAAVLTLYVDPPAQGAGIGTALLAAAEDALRQSGVREATLEVFEANGHGRSFYEARGWVHEEGVLVPDEWAPLVRYRRAL